MKVITKPTYKCEHCGKLYQIKNWCIKHELTCSKNPANFRPCFDCQHCELVEATVYQHDPMGGEFEYNVDVLKCNAKGFYLIPPKAEHKGNAFYFPDIENNPMPKECSQQKNGLLPFKI